MFIKEENDKSDKIVVQTHQPNPKKSCKIVAIVI